MTLPAGRLSRDAKTRLQAYSQLLQSLANRLGLIHLTSDQIYAQIDRSLALGEFLLRCIQTSGPHADLVYLDVGSGSGLPAIPVNVSLADTLGEQAPGVVMIEPKRKAVAFLEKVVRNLELSATVQPERAETAAREWGSKADFISAKALAQPKRALELCAPLCKIGGIIVLAARSQISGPTGGLDAADLTSLGLGPPASLTLYGPAGASQTILQVRKRWDPALRKGGEK